jgi:hypothetical protein
MKHRKDYTIFDREKIVAFIALVVFVAIIGFVIGRSAGEGTATCWILCKPGAQVNIRARADKDSRCVGFLEAGDDFRTDGLTKNGFVHALGVGDAGEGWIYLGFVVTDQPEAVFETYVCVAKKRAACRRWCGGPQISGKTGWIYNGSNVQVFLRSDEWCVTSRGYIQTAWLEPDPE